MHGLDVPLFWPPVASYSSESFPFGELFLTKEAGLIVPEWERGRIQTCEHCRIQTCEHRQHCQTDTVHQWMEYSVFWWLPHFLWETAALHATKAKQNKCCQSFHFSVFILCTVMLVWVYCVVKSVVICIVSYLPVYEFNALHFIAVVLKMCVKQKEDRKFLSCYLRKKPGFVPGAVSRNGWNLWRRNSSVKSWLPFYFLFDTAFLKL